MNNGNSTPDSSVWMIHIADDSEEEGLIAEVYGANVQIGVFTLDQFPDDETEPMVVLVDPDLPRYNAFWRESTIPQGLDPSSLDFGAAFARVMAFTIMRMQDKYGVG